LYSCQQIKGWRRQPLSIQKIYLSTTQKAVADNWGVAL